MTEPRRVATVRPLSKQQARIATLLADGLSMQQIADVLGVHWYTVRYHIQEAARRIPGGAWPPSVKVALWFRGASLDLLHEAPGASLRRAMLVAKVSKG